MRPLVGVLLLGCVSTPLAAPTAQHALEPGSDLERLGSSKCYSVSLVQYDELRHESREYNSQGTDWHYKDASGTYTSYKQTGVKPTAREGWVMNGQAAAADTIRARSGIGYNVPVLPGRGGCGKAGTLRDDDIVGGGSTGQARARTAQHPW